MLGFRVWEAGFESQGLGFTVHGLVVYGLWFGGLWFMAWWSMVYGLVVRVWWLPAQARRGCPSCWLVIRVKDVGCRVQV